MDETIYRMSLTESLLVLFVISLWLFAVIHLARKLDRICNPPSIRPNYSACPSAIDSTPLNPIEQSSTRTQTLVRCTSEPVIDPEQRPSGGTLVRFPTEICLPVQTPLKSFVYPKRLPSIVRRSLLDLHRRALSQTSNPKSLARIDDDEGEETTMIIASTRTPFLRKTYQRADAIDQETVDD